MIGTADPVAYALAIDALTHPGPADPARIPASVCSQGTMPGVAPNLNTLTQLLAAVPTLASVTLGFTAGVIAGAPVVTSEPALACYVTAGCTGAAAPTLLLRVLGRPRLTTGRSERLRVLVRTREGTALDPVRAATVTFDGGSSSTSASGIAILTVRPRFQGRYAVDAALKGCNTARAALRVVG